MCSEMVYNIIIIKVLNSDDIHPLCCAVHHWKQITLISIHSFTYFKSAQFFDGVLSEFSQRQTMRVHGCLHMCVCACMHVSYLELGVD